MVVPCESTTLVDPITGKVPRWQTSWPASEVLRIHRWPVPWAGRQGLGLVNRAKARTIDRTGSPEGHEAATLSGGRRQAEWWWSEELCTAQRAICCSTHSVPPVAFRRKASVRVARRSTDTPPKMRHAPPIPWLRVGLHLRAPMARLFLTPYRFQSPVRGLCRRLSGISHVVATPVAQLCTPRYLARPKFPILRTLGPMSSRAVCVSDGVRDKLTHGPPSRCRHRHLKGPNTHEPSHEQPGKTRHMA